MSPAEHTMHLQRLTGKKMSLKKVFLFLIKSYEQNQKDSLNLLKDTFNFKQEGYNLHPDESFFKDAVFRFETNEKRTLGNSCQVNFYF